MRLLGTSGIWNGPDASGMTLSRDSAEPQIATQWARIRGRLQADVGDVEYRTWLRQMTLVGIDGDEVTVHLPSRFLRDWVRSHYGEKITRLWQQENPRIRRVDIRVDRNHAALAESVSEPPAAAAPAASESISMSNNAQSNTAGAAKPPISRADAQRRGRSRAA